MKIGVFSGVYYCDQNSSSPKKKTLPTSEKLQTVMTAFEKEKVDLCFCIGNLVDQERQSYTQIFECFEAVSETIHSRDIPFYFVPAPQDFLQTDLAALTKLTGLYQTQYTIHTDDILFVVLDGNYTFDMCHYSKKTSGQTEFYLPSEQMTALKKRLSMFKKCVVLTYHNIDGNVPSRFTLKNADDVRETIKASKHTQIVLQGAYPYETDTVIDNTRYITVPSMRENETDFYKIIEI